MNVILVHTKFNPKKPLTIVSHLIRKVAGVFNNHGSVQFGHMIYESDMSGVVKVPIHEWAKDQIITVYEVDSTKYNVDVMEAVAESLVGKRKYDFWSLIVWQPINILFNIYLGSKGRCAEYRLYCFEFIAYLFNWKDFYKISPKTFNVRCDNRFKKIHANIKVEDYIKTLAA